MRPKIATDLASNTCGKGLAQVPNIHFIIAWLLVAFVAIHVFQVIVTGLWNNLRSMITGRYAVKPEKQA